ncbi:MAG: GNAT family N-acetyltransferase, partial [Rhizobiaceae bacterium]
MSSTTIKIGHIRPECQSEIYNLAAEAFGPGRFARTAFRLREFSDPKPELSFMAEVSTDTCNQTLAGSVELTDIRIGDNPALLLGPLVVSPHLQKLGIGRELMNRAVHDATK